MLTPSQHVNVLPNPNFIFVEHKPFIGGQSHLYKKNGGDSIDLFLVFQVERKIVMTAWRLHWGHRESSLLIKGHF